MLWCGRVWGWQLADHEEGSDEWDNLFFGLGSLIQPLRLQKQIKAALVHAHIFQNTSSSHYFDSNRTKQFIPCVYAHETTHIAHIFLATITPFLHDASDFISSLKYELYYSPRMKSGCSTPELPGHKQCISLRGNATFSCALLFITQSTPEGTF